MNKFNKEGIFLVNDKKGDGEYALEWTDEVLFRIKSAANTIQDVFELKEAFTTETLALVVASNAEITALMKCLNHAVEFHSANTVKVVCNPLSKASIAAEALIENTSSQHKEIMSWFS